MILWPINCSKMAMKPKDISSGNSRTELRLHGTARFLTSNMGGGDSTNVAPLEFDVISNGKPTVTPAL
mgnify:CR=1 FL=1